jgi:hypothetical protein
LCNKYRELPCILLSFFPPSSPIANTWHYHGKSVITDEPILIIIIN